MQDSPVIFIALAGIAGLILGLFLAGHFRGKHPGSGTISEKATSLHLALHIDDLVLHLVRETDAHVLLQHAAEWLHQFCKVTLVVAYQYDPATHELINPVVVGGTLTGLAQRLRLGYGLYGEVAQTRSASYVGQVLREPRLGATLKTIQTAYFMPLIHDVTLLGVLCLQTEEPSALNADRQVEYNQIAGLIAAFMMMAVRLKNSQQTITKFDRFQGIAQRLSYRLDSYQLLQEIVEAAREMLDTQMSVLLNMQPDSDELRPIAWAGISAETAALLHSRLKHDLKGIVAWAQQPARTANLRTDQRTASTSQSVVAGMLSELVVPVMYFDELYGVLAVETSEHRHFTDEETNLLNALASHAAIALHNARLFESLQQSKLELEKTVSDLVVARQQAENAQVAAVEANRLKTEFVNNMSHELRTPLNAVINFTRIVADGHAGTINEQQVQYLTFVHDSGQHLLGLINDILDLAKIEAGKMELRCEPSDLEPIIRGVMSTAVGLTRSKGLILKQEMAPDVPKLTIDAVRIRQVLLNLLSNAAKFTMQGGITVRVERRERDVVVSVQDTGIGIRAEDIPKVFEEFRQIDGSLARTETGTGLGMPISQRFVQLHGGEMWIESEVNVGTTIYFSLPLSEA